MVYGPPNRTSMMAAGMNGERIRLHPKQEFKNEEGQELKNEERMRLLRKDIEKKMEVLHQMQYQWLA